jgi:hypothetical protein
MTRAYTVLARVLRHRLRSVDADVLAEIKSALTEFNAKRGVWKSQGRTIDDERREADLRLLGISDE